MSLFVVGVDSPASNVTGGWMDKTKDQINSFSPSLIAQWEPKVFLFLLQALAKLLIYLEPLEYGVPAHLALSKKQRLSPSSFSALRLPVNLSNLHFFQKNSLKTGENVMKSHYLN